MRLPIRNESVGVDGFSMVTNCCQQILKVTVCRQLVHTTGTRGGLAIKRRLHDVEVTD
jgi:hypothetical protein